MFVSLSSLLVLIIICFAQAIILFLCGKRDDAILRVNDLIDIVDDKSLYCTVRVCQWHDSG